MKNILIFAATSDISKSLIPILLKDDWMIYATSRKKDLLSDSRLKLFNLDLTDKCAIEKFFSQINGVKFDVIINFQGVAISSPIEFLNENELRFQLDVSLFSLLNILKKTPDFLNPNGKVINISSMACYGIFPFISPYEIAKSSADILLSVFEIETGIKTVSIKPGVIGTKFWKYCVDINSKNFAKFTGKYEKTGKFLSANALSNASRGITPDYVAKKIYKILTLKNPKASYNLGFDSHFVKFVSLFKGRILYNVIRFILNMKVKYHER